MDLKKKNQLTQLKSEHVNVMDTSHKDNDHIIKEQKKWLPKLT